MTKFASTGRVSKREACKLLGVPRSVYYYKPRERKPRAIDAPLTEFIVDLSRERWSFGYRRLTALARRKLGVVINTKKVRRIMKFEGLELDQKRVTPRVRVKRHQGKQITSAPDVAYQMDNKEITCGRDGRLFLQSIHECCTGEWLGYVLSHRNRAEEAMECLLNVVASRFPEKKCAPGTRLRVDNGSCYKSYEFVDKAIELGFEVEFIKKKTPEDNGVIESFHASLDRDYLNGYIFANEIEARELLARFFHDYNHEKPKERLGWKTPAEYRATFTTPNGS